MATLDLKDMGKFLWKGRGKSLPSWLSWFSSFKPKIAIAEFFWKMQRKTWYSIYGGRCHASFPQKSVIKISLFLWTIDLHVHESTSDTSFDLLFSLYLVLNFHTTREEQLLPRHSAITGLQNKIHERCLTSKHR